MSEAWRARWSALEANEDGQLNLYATAPGAVREVILRELCTQGRWDFLARLVATAGVWPGHAGALEGALALGAASEPLWWLVWREQAGLSRDSWLTDALLHTMTARGQRMLMALSRAPGASWLASDLVERTAGRHAIQPQTGPFDALWGIEACWTLEAQLLFASPRHAALGIERLIEVVDGLVRTGRGAGLLMWLMGWLAESERSWQPVLERVWSLVPASEALCAAICARWRAQIAAGCAITWIASEQARALADLRGGELPGLPWSLGRLAARVEDGALAPHEYVALISVPESFAAVQTSPGAPTLTRTIQRVHERASGMQLAALLKAVPRGTSRWCELLWLEVGKRPESLVRLELARLIARLELKQGCAWLESMVAQTRDERMAQELAAALQIVGDARSVAALEAAKRHNVLTHEAFVRLSSVLSERPLQPRAEVDQRALVSANQRWEALALAPRRVDVSVAQRLRLETHPKRTEHTVLAAWLLPLAWWGAALLLYRASDIWVYETIKAMSWLILVGQAVLLVMTWHLAGIWRMYWSTCDKHMVEMLAQGEAGVGTVFGVGEAKQVAFVDSAGTRRLIDLTPTQAARVAHDEQVNLLYRAGGRDEVLIVRGLDVDEGGRLVAQDGELWTFVELWGVRLLWLSIIPIVFLVGLVFLIDVLDVLIRLVFG
jgi:hypothetical protein